MVQLCCNRVRTFPGSRKQLQQHQQVVCFGSERNQTQFKRADSEFAGSFSSQDSDDFPAWLRYEAWDERLINATWHCTHICGADTTLNEDQKKARLDRVHAWQNKREEVGKGRATASSSAAGSANPTSGKGAAKEGKRKRTLEGKQEGTGKGMKKGWSKYRGQASRRRTG